jgi:Flp pilus assembly protein TadG
MILPFLVALLAGVWEVGRMVEIQQILKNAAREAGRQASTAQLSTSQVQQVALNYLTLAKVNNTGANVTVTNLTSGARSDPTAANQMDHYQIQVTLPFDNVRWILLNQITSIHTLTASADWYSVRDNPVSVSTNIPIE